MFKIASEFAKKKQKQEYITSIAVSSRRLKEAIRGFKAAVNIAKK